jgi:imidazolonepropionase
MRTLIKNIKYLCQVEQDSELKQLVSGAAMATVPYIENAWLLMEDDCIHSFGKMNEIIDSQIDAEIDSSDCLVLPAWCDSHTHLVFAAPREQEFVGRIKGLSYEEIARNGGGILNSAAKLRLMDELELYDQSYLRLQQVMRQGTGAIEIKSGYGLSLDAELKMLRVIRSLKENTGMPIKASFLAAHAYPIEYKNDKEAYVKLIIDKMLPEVANEGLADYMDVFCEEGFFSVADTDRLLTAAAKYGLKPKIHANQLHYSGGVQIGVQHKAISVDHLECVAEAEIEALKSGNTMPTLLPAAAFFLGIQYQPARKIIDAGLPVCLASDYNPGSCPSGNMNLLATIACTQLKMTPSEVIHAMTINGAAAMELQQDYGSIAVGKKANLIITKPMPSLDYIPYDFGNNPVNQMIINGKSILT